MFLVFRLILIGGATGVLSGLLGVGGAFVLVPLLSTQGILMRRAAALSLLYVTFTAASGVFRHLRQGTIDPILGLIIVTGATPTAIVGSHFATMLPDRILQLLFAFLMIATGVAYLRRGQGISPVAEGLFPANERVHHWYVLLRRRQVGNEEVRFTINILCGLAIGACLGFLSGLLGVGGGWILVPALVLFLRTPLRVAVGTSLLSIVLPALVGATTHWQLGNLDVEAFAPLILSGIVGAQLGATLLARIPPAWLERLFIFLFAVAAAYMLGQGLGLI